MEKQKKGKKKVKGLQKRYKVLETFAGHRETPKYYIVVTIDYIRRKLLELAKYWVETGRLDSVERIFDLKLKEVLQAEEESDLDLRPHT